MNKIRLQNAIDSLSRLTSIDENKKKDLIERFSNMDDKDVIKELSLLAYRTFRNNEEYYIYSLTVIQNINPKVCPPVEEMKNILLKMFSNEVEGNMSLEDNHKLVNESLIKFTTLFNQAGIDYYIVGALPCFLKTGIPLFRYHDDIDIMINEDDIPKITELIELSGYSFQDDRFPTLERLHEMQQNKPPHTVLAQNPKNEFHLGFFTFRREQDKSITMREYSHREENGEVVVEILERTSDPIATSLRYDENPTEYYGTSFRTSTVESVYNLKSYTKRPKDITDMQKLESYIDKEKLVQINLHKNENITYKNIVQQEINDGKHL
ncbi:MAG: hypothetical protein Q4E75_03860 [bacterium]|nr:hypothetical protein [bacterium]